MLKIKPIIFGLIMAMISLMVKCSVSRKQMNYYQEEVNFCNNKADVKLSGTLTMPNNQGKFPGIILIAGYGPNDRDVNSMGHKYFLVLAQYLTQQGFAVLRYDKRGVGKSTGVYDTATSQDFANDVSAGIEYLNTRKDIQANKIGLIGLSEGGLIASMVAGNNNVAFVVLMAPALVNSADYFVEMSSAQLRADGASEIFLENDRKIRKAVYSIVTQEQNRDIAQKELQKVIADYLNSLPEAQKLEAEKLPFAFTAAKADILVKVFNSFWYRFFWSYDIPLMLRSIKVPVLCIIGDKDHIASSKKVFTILEKTLTEIGNKNYKLIELPNLNHTFQTCKTGSLAEYATISETFAPIALKTISNWLVDIIK